MSFTVGVHPFAHEYVPDDGGKHYFSLNYHRKKSQHKSAWLRAIGRDREYGLFDVADKRGWCDVTYIWNVGRGGKEILGTDDERIDVRGCNSPK